MTERGGSSAGLVFYSDALLDEVAIRGRGKVEPYAEQPFEGTMHVSAAVPSEHELVEVALHVALPEAVEGALGPSLEVREDAVDPVQEVVRLPPRDDADLVRVRRRVFVSKPAVGDDVRTGFNASTDETMQGVPRPVRDVREPDATGLPILR